MSEPEVIETALWPPPTPMSWGAVDSEIEDLSGAERALNLARQALALAPESSEPT